MITILEAFYKNTHFNFPYLIHRCRHQVRDCATKIKEHHYSLAVPLLIVQLARVYWEKSL